MKPRQSATPRPSNSRLGRGRDPLEDGPVMRPDPNNVIQTIPDAPAASTSEYTIHHRYFPEIQAFGRTRWDAATDLFRRLEGSADVTVDQWHRDQLGDALDDLITWSSPDVPSPHRVGAWEPQLITDRDNLYRIRLWSSERDWKESEVRPDRLKYVEGLGWIGAAFVRCLGGVPPAPPRRDQRAGDNRVAAPETSRPDRVDQRRGERRDRDRRHYDRWTSFLTGRLVPAVPLSE